MTRLTGFFTAAQNVRFWHKADIARPSSNVRFGSKADIGGRLGNVRFTPKSGHRSARWQCPLCAKSRHFTRHLAGAGRGSNLWPSIVAGGNGGHATIAGKPIKYSRRVSEVIARAAANV